MSAELVPMFTGEPVVADSTEVTPATFVKKLRAHMRDLGTDNTQNPDARKIDAFLDYLVENSPAEKWFKMQQASATPFITWAALEAAFHIRFPGPEKAERTPQEWERELVAMKLTLGELGSTVKVGGAEVFAHVHFAMRLLDIAREAGIANTTGGIWQSRDALPEVIREKIPATQTDWITYTNAIKNVDRVHIREGVAKARKAQDLDRRVAQVEARSPPLTPVSKMAVRFGRTGIAVPPGEAIAPLPMRAPAGAANPFGGGGGQGNLFTPPAMTEEGKVHLRRIMVGLGASMLQDDAAGRAEYARRVASWIRVHGTNRVLLERTGYPLSPGTLPPASGECYGCGKLAIPWHKRADCPGPAVPAKESTFCSLCAKYLKEPRAPAAVNAVLEEETGWMDFVQYEDGEDFGTGPSE
ncbi:hypothetical protein GGX14DRAFT_556783 [Mycena pura]|uniref:Uncharacterized protein n=1 Tax=Mycena pura TaxID=153505 RepID=A0AAD7E389_9AGAR|nr:hypothetical protein GGX14DRAFT_556783 [Mycena pura]